MQRIGLFSLKKKVMQKVVNFFIKMHILNAYIGRNFLNIE